MKSFRQHHDLVDISSTLGGKHFRRVMAWGIMLLMLSTASIGCGRFVHWQNPFRPKPEYHTTEVAPPRYRVQASPQLAVSQPQRVLILATAAEAATQFRTTASQRLIDELATSMREFGGLEVLAPIGEQLRTSPRNFLSGKFDEQEIADLARRYRADTVCLVRVNDLKEHFPLRVNVSLAFIDTYETVVTLSVEGTWDTSYELTRRDFEHFVLATVQRRGTEIESAPVEFQSPQFLLAFAGVELVQAIREGLQQTHY